MLLSIILLTFILLAGLSTPIAVIILVIATIGIVWEGVPLTMLTQMIVNGVRSQTLLAIPFYIFVGELMNRGGITERIFEFALSIIGHIKGGLGHVNVLASMIFAGISGSSTADAAGLGRVEIDAMNKEGYDRDFSAAITAASSTIGPIIPPSIHLVIYGAIAEVQVATLFIGGIIPGVLMGISLMLAVYYLASTGRVKCPTRKRMPLSAVFISFKRAIGPLLAPIVIVGGIMTGVVTPTEAGVIAVIYSLILGYLLKELNIKVIGICIKNTIYSTAVVMFMLAVSRVFAWFITIQRVPELIINSIFAVTDNHFIILFFMNIILLLLGMVGTAASNIVIITPIFVTIAAQLGMDLVHMGIIIVLGLMIGLITPPVGTSLYVLADVAKISFERVVKATLVFTIPLIVVLYIITYFPQLTTYLPEILGH